MKSVQFFSFLTLLSLSTPIFSQDKMTLEESTGVKKLIQTKTDKILAQIATKTTRDTIGSKLADASPRLKNKNVYLSADLLYWTLYQDFSIANTLTLYQFPSAAGSYVTKNFVPNFDWSFAFKAGIGTYLGHDNWQTGLNFTWFNTKAEQSLTSNAPNEFVFVADVGGGGGGNGRQYSFAKQKILFDYYDLIWTLNRAFFVSHYLNLQPQIGAKFNATFERNLVNAISGGNQNPAFNDLPEKQNKKNQSLAGGPLAGLSAQFFFCKNWSLTGLSNTSVMYCLSKSKYVFDQYSTSQFGPTPYAYTMSSTTDYHHMLAFLEAGLFLGYNSNFAKNKANISVQVGWDANFYFTVAQHPLLQNQVGGFDLNLTFSF